MGAVAGQFGRVARLRARSHDLGAPQRHHVDRPARVDLGLCARIRRGRSNPALQEPSGQEGVSSVLDEMFDYGTATQDRNAFQRALDDIGSSINAGTGFALQTTSSDFDRGVSLLAQNELTPRLDEQTLGIRGSAPRRPCRPRSTARIRRPSAKPTAKCSARRSGTARADDVVAERHHPRRRAVVLRASVPARHHDDRGDRKRQPRARSQHDRKAFGAWHAGGTPPNLKLPPVPVNPPGDVHVAPPAMRQDNVTLEQMVSIRRTDPAYYGSRSATRSWAAARAPSKAACSRLAPEQRARVLRQLETRGGPDAGAFSHRLRVRGQQPHTRSADRQQRHRTFANRECRSIRARTDEGIGRPALAIGQSSTDAIGNALLSNSTSGLPLDEDHIAAQRYLATDAAAVRSAMATYIKPQNFVRTIEGP